MPRANRFFLPGYVWHITHRCHKKEFLLKFSRDRRRWIHWLFQARRRFGLCVLNYMVTSNHVHLLVKDTGSEAIPRSMQLIAGRTAQEYNRRKNRNGAFWEDRYHATVVDASDHLIRCLVYIDLNMVRAGVVGHPAEWADCGYHEIQRSTKRNRVVDLRSLQELLGFNRYEKLQAEHTRLVMGALAGDSVRRDPAWSESLAVGRRDFVEDVKERLGLKARYRDIVGHGSGFLLKEPSTPYMFDFEVEKDGLTHETTVNYD
jgi:putative transposase